MIFGRMYCDDVEETVRQRLHEIFVHNASFAAMGTPMFHRDGRWVYYDYESVVIGGLKLYDPEAMPRDDADSPRAKSPARRVGRAERVEPSAEVKDSDGESVLG